MKEKDKTHQKDCNMHGGGVSNAVYGMGFIGALIYFIGHASNFTDGVIGVLKAIVWPGILVYKALELLGM